MSPEQIKRVKQFIKENQELLNNRDFAALYTELDHIDETTLDSTRELLTPLFTDIMLKIKENPLSNMAYIPECFALDLDIKSFNIPSNIEYIKPSAFENCLYLKNVKFLGNKLKKIGAYCFKNCTDLEEITLPNNVKVIDSWAFEGCGSLKYIKLGSNLRDFSTDIFKSCPVLQEVYIDITLDKLNKIFLADEDYPSINLIKCKDGLAKLSPDYESWELVEE